MTALARTGDWIQTYTGVMYYAHDPRPEDIDIRDVAHHLAMECRYTGACKWHYSVAQHSCYVHDVLPQPLKFKGLMHDAPEYVAKDMAKPTKSNLPDYKVLERKNWLATAARFSLPIELDPEVHAADAAVLLAEYQVLMVNPSLPGYDYSKAAPIRIARWTPERAEREFLYRFYRLVGKVS